MILNDFGFIITDTPRSSIYLQVLIKHNLIPKYFIYLKNKKKQKLPEMIKTKKKVFNLPDKYTKFYGKKMKINIDILSELKKLNAEFDVYNTTNIHKSYVINKIITRKEKNFIYSGYSGVILKKQILSVKKNFLHVHGGFLPKFKGSTTNYYSILEEDTIGATSIFMSKEVDSGPILYRSKFKFNNKKNEIDDFYDSFIRSIVLAKTVSIYSKKNKWVNIKKNVSKSNSYYIIHPILKHLAILS